MLTTWVKTLYSFICVVDRLWASVTTAVADYLSFLKLLYVFSLDRPTDTALTTTPTNTTVLRGSTVSLNCSTDANPAAHLYQFYFNNSFINNSISGVLNITVDTDGVYTCVPVNTVGTGRNATVSITVVGKYIRNFVQLSNFAQ